MWCRSAAVLAIAAVGCSADGAAQPDTALPPDSGAAAEARGRERVGPGYRVAAVQYGDGDFAKVGGCATDLCALARLVQQARQAGARLVVLPEYVGDQKAYEAVPGVGDRPASDARWPAGSHAATLAKLADDEELTLLFQVLTADGAKKFNTLVAADADGRVVARHHKFQLYKNEIGKLTPGDSLGSSFFDTPAGRLGLMVCADASCVAMKMVPLLDTCWESSVTLLKDYFSPAKRPALIALSSLWTSGAALIGALDTQRTLASYGQAYLIAANTTQGPGKGGGIYAPSGEPLVLDASGTPTALVAEVPLR
jgi:predicted amidohydrolase